MKNQKYNDFLGKVSSRLIKTSPYSVRNYLVREATDRGEPLVEIWFRTRGCHYFLKGGCTMCNYGYGPNISSEEMVTYVKKALASTKITKETHLLISPSGSFLDEWEVPIDARKGILETVADIECASFAFETRENTIDEPSIENITNTLGKLPLKIALGLESATPWILKYSVNKDIDLIGFSEAMKLLKKYNIFVSINVALGAPFLAPNELIDDAVKTLDWAFNNGADECYIHPVNVKIGTLVHWLWENGLYEPVSLWTLIEILKKIDISYIPRTTTAWYKTYYQDEIELQKKYKASPHTCPTCQRQVVEMLDEYVETRSSAIIRKLDSYDCQCKSEWRSQSLLKNDAVERAIYAYNLMGNNILSRHWWENNGDQVLKDLRTSSY